MKRYAGLLSILLLLTLTGCWDQLELEEQAFVVVLGLDKAPEDNLVSITFQIANPQVGSSDKGVAEGEPPSDIITFTAPDILSAKELANSVITRKISFAHLRTVIIGQSFAKETLFQHVMGSSVRDPEMRRETHMVVTKEKAAQFIRKNKSQLETRPHKYYQFMQERWRDTGYVPYSTLNRYLQRLSSDTLFLTIFATTEEEKTKAQRDDDDYVAGEIRAKGGDPAQIMGSAVLRTGVMIGKLTGEETRMALLLRRKSLTHSFIMAIPDPLDDRYRLTLRLIKDGNTDIRMNLGQDPITIRVKIPMRVQVLSIPSFVNYRSDLNKQRKLHEELEHYLRSNMMQLIDRAQREFHGEPFLWHLHARKQFMTWQRYEQYDWSKHFCNAKVSIDFDLEIESFGKQASPPTVTTPQEELR